ncbi:MAG: hypothetical protein U0703_15530 [Anaerolineae bacterium]
MPLLDARYRGQAYELTIPYTEDVPTAFHAAHDRAYGHALPGREIEQVNLRLQAVGAVDKPSPDARSICDNDGSGALIRRRDGMALYQREQFTPGARFGGAALIFQLDSTVYVPEGWSARVDEYQDLVLTSD